MYNIKYSLYKIKAKFSNSLWWLLLLGLSLLVWILILKTI